MTTAQIDIDAETPAVEKNPRRAVILLSGGLDSTLAARVMVDQGIELHALHFTSPFCTCSRARSGCHSQAQLVARELGIPIRTVSKGPEYIEIVRNPKHGRGSAMNPCIDCRIFTLRKGREHMDRIGASFLVTGEVLGQRPMSQRNDAMRLIEKRAEVQGLVLRPLSAMRLPPTIPDIEGWVDRAKLLGIAGRGRKEQMRLAEEYRIGDYPCPAGGCLLTDKGFSVKVRDLFKHTAAPDAVDLNLLKVGRHFRLPDGKKVIVSRDEMENGKLAALGPGRVRLYLPQGFSGPAVGIAGVNGETPIGILARVYTRYSKPGTPAPYRVRETGDGIDRIVAVPHDPDFREMEDALLR